MDATKRAIIRAVLFKRQYERASDVIKINRNLSMNTHPFAKQQAPHQQECYSVPVPFRTREIPSTTVEQWKIQAQQRQSNVGISMRNDNDRDYQPNREESSEDSFSSSYVSENSRNSGYDPLQNLEEYMRMRDRL